MPTVGGGRAGGGGRPGGSFGGGHPGGGFGGSFGGRPGGYHGGPHRPYRPGGFFWGPGWGWGWGPRWGWGFGGCLGPILIFPIVIFLVIALSIGALFTAPDDAGITRSTRARKPMSAEYVTPIDEYFHDGPGVIDNAAYQYQLENSMKSFYQRTGVQPYLYIDDDLDGNTKPNYIEVEAFLKDKYRELFGEDEGHFFLLYFEYPDATYNLWYVAGDNTGVVMDGEACDILLDYIEYYYPRSEHYSEMFIKSFDSAADRIMGGRTSIFEGMSAGSIILLVIAGVGLIVVIVIVIKRYRATAPGSRGPDDGPNGGPGKGSGGSGEDRRKDKYRRRYGK